MSDLQDALERHDAPVGPSYAEDFDLFVEAARLAGDGHRGTLIRSEWNGDRRIWTLRMDEDVDLASHQLVIVAAALTPPGDTDE